jgi:hypothetical protein
VQKKPRRPPASSELGTMKVWEDDAERSVEHPQEPAEGAEETEEAPGAERAEGDR